MLSNIGSQNIVTWRGLAFENVCFNHVKQIKKALGISGVSTNQSAWSKRKGEETGTQIDMIIERKDNIVNMCEKMLVTQALDERDLLVKKIADKIAKARLASKS